ncbi:MAG: XTP/dITP diphosphatase [Candidatus Glassbacteria bacterium]|nr:XTP/dITP diphosphatase [Candidatus Glassbacteria bacterium]
MLLVATTNLGKIIELGELLADAEVEVLGLEDIPQGKQKPPEEHGLTFRENAVAKASCWRQRTGLATVADDSGLVVDILDGEPGIHSARYAGATASDADNNNYLLNKLDGMPAENRKAAFHCCLALCRPGREPVTFEGRAEGVILDTPRGGMGFGYDPLFYYPPLGKTFAQLDPAEKNRVSHRAVALRKFLDWLEHHSLSD